MRRFGSRGWKKLHGRKIITTSVDLITADELDILSRDRDLTVHFHYELPPQVCETVLQHIENVREDVLLIAPYVEEKLEADWASNISLIGSSTKSDTDRFYRPDEASFREIQQKILCRSMQTFNQREMLKLLVHLKKQRKAS